ncbi:hypothetical protein Deipr_0493 [Deinococcus proteolyticus MRP]|uniref:Thioredoxin-like fold domain-containing protein n=1 Tax=Deinococcus proteolyticus (strain ATCC 35074 / DSM 20540 / JCM 6276 / NBRC 101906 / NCIMB 13154 / VKM Ac-1939 / CCM 2703 / MRP) TaxID=693977 RepID=F0RKA2_DEIPM|nr:MULTISPECIES: thioredoxin domain-containing protein [Deinococcus]ADY25661.1 hypothetical protein Deipr_0493 [Deinococcus proteolyticus MRP]MCY1701778.1 thioredoxin domain-containing protein [Deinococcus sp. SL84]
MTKLQGNRSNNMPLIIGTLIAAALIALALFAGRGKSGEQASTASGAAASAKFDLSNKPVVGDASAPVEMIVVEDFKCPACKQFEATVFPKVENEYVSTGKVKVYSVAWPFLAEVAKLDEDDSKYAAQAGECAYEHGGAEAFSAYKTILFRAQEDESKVWATKARLKELAANVSGIDQTAFASCLDNDETLARVEANEEEVEASGVTGTPTVFIGGKKVENPGDYGQLKSAIDAALAN